MGSKAIPEVAQSFRTVLSNRSLIKKSPIGILLEAQE
jgi:hypothetical protein